MMAGTIGPVTIMNVTVVNVMMVTEIRGICVA
jgi:hypothetical protein